MLSRFRERLENDWGDGGFPPSDGGDGGGGGGDGGKGGFVFVDAATYCAYLEEFARAARSLAAGSEGSPEKADERAVKPPEGKHTFAHYFDFPGYAQRLWSRASAVRAIEKNPRRNQTFVLCKDADGEVISVSQLDEMSCGERSDLRLRTIDWPIERLSYKFYLVPPRVVKSRIQLRSWLETQGYNVQDDPCDPYGI
jgi:hypothetical protein